jgi:hypothetical protein
MIHFSPRWKAITQRDPVTTVTPNQKPKEAVRPGQRGQDSPAAGVSRMQRSGLFGISAQEA